MIEHHEERKKFGNALKERVVAKFGLERMVEEVERVVYRNSTTAEA